MPKSPPCVLVALLLLGAPSIAAADMAAAMALSALLEQLESFSASFEQRVYDRDGSELQASQGTMTVARGNRFHWATSSPWEQVLVSDGETLWQYDADLEQVVERPFDASLQQTPGLLLGGDIGALEAQFEVEEGASPGGGQRRFTLHPRAQDSLFARLEMHFVGGDPAGMSLVDGFGQQTVITFQDGVRNAAVVDALFRFEPPAGVDVVRDAP